MFSLKKYFVLDEYKKRVVFSLGANTLATIIAFIFLTLLISIHFYQAYSEELSKLERIEANINRSLKSLIKNSNDCLLNTVEKIKQTIKSDSHEQVVNTLKRQNDYLNELNRDLGFRYSSLRFVASDGKLYGPYGEVRTGRESVAYPLGESSSSSSEEAWLFSASSKIFICIPVKAVNNFDSILYVVLPEFRFDNQLGSVNKIST